MEELDYLFKVVIVGDKSVGKTSIMNKYNYGDEGIENNLGIEFINKIQLVDGDQVGIQLWDMLVLERFKLKWLYWSYN